MQSREMTIEEWLNNEELPVTIWRKKYQQKGENFEQWLNRISAGDETVKELIREKKFIFAGSHTFKSWHQRPKDNTQQLLCSDATQ